MRIRKIKQQKNILEKAVSSALGAFVLMFIIYIYQNVNIVFKMISYKNSANKIVVLEKDLLSSSDQLIEQKKNLSLDKKNDFNFAEINTNSDSFVVRKNTLDNFSMLVR